MTVEINGNFFFSPQYLLNDTPSINTKQDAERLISDILNKYNNAGFPFCRISPEIIRNDDASARMILTIEEGKRVIIEDLFINTKARTNVGAAKRIADFRPGGYFSLKTVAAAKKKLAKTNAFEKIGDNVVERDGKYYLLLTLDEKESDFLMVSGSLGGTNLQFGASYSSFNLLGTLRQLGFVYQHQKLFSLKFREPVLIAPVILDVDFSIWTFDSMRQIEGHMQFSAPVGEHISISLLSGIELVNDYRNDTLTVENSDNLLGCSIVHEYEARGWSVAQTLNIQYLFRAADRFKAAYDGEISPWKFVIGIHYHRVWADSFDFFDYLRIGGAKNLRGYLEDEFLARRAFWVSLEYHRLLIYPMLDVARIDDDFLFSYGFGIEAKSRLADASLILAWPKGGTWDDGKLHLTLTRGF
jgi:outer membrane protein assembly factor BamA